MSHHANISNPAPNVNVIGYGSAGRALSLALHQAGITISAVFDLPRSPNLITARDDGFTATSLGTTKLDCDLLIIATPDSSIEKLAASLATRPELVELTKSNTCTALHLSGAHGLTPLQPLAALGWHTAAFHPIQTFPPGSGPERFNGIHVGITADSSALPMMRELASRLGVQPMIVPEQDRARYHLASVIVSNFLPLLLDMGADYLDGIADDRESAAEALLPLMRGMLDSLGTHNPIDALTGPVARNDLATVRAHLESELDETTGKMYRQLTLALVDMAERGGRMSSNDASIWREFLA
jgi:predicted short-subunit dehydrogenase-like oxidoreductase (DUF2520 family)